VVRSRTSAKSPSLTSQVISSHRDRSKCIEEKPGKYHVTQVIKVNITCSRHADITLMWHTEEDAILSLGIFPTVHKLTMKRNLRETPTKSLLQITDQYSSEVWRSPQQATSEEPSQTGGHYTDMVSAMKDSGTQRHEWKSWWNSNKVCSEEYCANVNFLVVIIGLWLCKMLTLGKAGWHFRNSLCCFSTFL
jgi:hypothetical protein